MTTQAGATVGKENDDDLISTTTGQGGGPAGTHRTPRLESGEGVGRPGAEFSKETVCAKAQKWK